MNYMILEHLSGSRANQVDEFALNQFKELLIGRDVSANVKFSESEIMVGRRHLKIEEDPTDPARILITDLNSRNGTFINGTRIEGSQILKIGDVVQCGPSGPQFRFRVKARTDPLQAETSPTQLDETPPPQPPGPPPVNFALAHLASPSAKASGDSARAKSARIESPRADSARAESAPGEPAREEPVVFVGENEGEKTGKLWFIGGGALLTVLAAVIGVLGYRSFVSSKVVSTPTATATPLIAEATSKATPSPEATPNPATATDAESDADRVAWRLDVLPFKTLGSGHPGKNATDMDRPDGVAFSPSGLLYVSDVGNQRVQVWDVKAGKHLGEFGNGVFAGEIAEIAVAPNETVYVTDSKLNVAYTFAPGPRGAQYYDFTGTRFGDQQIKKLGAMTIDSRGRIYVVDEQSNDVHRFKVDHTLDSTFNFEPQATGATYAHGDGLVIDETGRNLLLASEQERAVLVFDAETGAFKQRLGAGPGKAESAGAKPVFFGPVAGMTLTRGHLLALDKKAGHIQLFDLARPDAYNHDLASFGRPQPKRPAAYRGFLGRAPLVNFEDQTNIKLQRQILDGTIVPGKANPPGYFCAPESIASFTEAATGETYVAVADRCNYRLVVYRWSDIGKALGQPITLTAAKAASPPVAKAKPAPKAAPKPVVKAPPKRKDKYSDEEYWRNERRRRQDDKYYDERYRNRRYSDKPYQGRPSEEPYDEKANKKKEKKQKAEKPY